MSVTSLACIAAVIIACHVFLYLVRTQKEIHEKDRKIRLWHQRMAAEAKESIHVASSTPTVTTGGAELESLPTVMEAGPPAEPVAIAEPIPTAEPVSQP